MIRKKFDLSCVFVQASANRAFARKTVMGLFFFLLLLAVIAQWDLHRVRSGRAKDPNDPLEYKRRIVIFLTLCAPFFILIADHHLRSAQEIGGSIWPAIFGLGISLTALAGTIFFIFRKGPFEAQERSQTLLRWVVPVAVIAGLVSLFAAIFGI